MLWCRIHSMLQYYISNREHRYHACSIYVHTSRHRRKADVRCTVEEKDTSSHDATHCLPYPPSHLLARAAPVTTYCGACLHSLSRRRWIKLEDAQLCPWWREASITEKAYRRYTQTLHEFFITSSSSSRSVLDIHMQLRRNWEVRNKSNCKFEKKNAKWQCQRHSFLPSNLGVQHEERCTMMKENRQREKTIQR